MYDALARLANSRPGRVLVITLFAFVVGGLVGGPVAGLLNKDNDSFLDRESASVYAIERIQEATGMSATPDILVLANIADTASVNAALSTLSTDPGVALVVGGPDGGPDFTSRDGTQTFMAALYRADANPNEVTKRLRDELAGIDGVTVGGPGPTFQLVNEQVESDLIKAEIIAFPLLFIASLWVFRSAVAALLPLLVGGLTIVLSLLAIRGINEGVDISIFALNLITGLGLGLSIDYSLFMVSRFREELARTGEKAEAIRTTVATAGRTVVFSAVTVAGAGLALLVFPLRFLYSMGIGVTVVALIAAAVSVLVLPSVFAVLGHRVNALAPKRWQRARERDEKDVTAGFWYRLAKFVMRYPVAIALVGATILLVLGAPFLGVKLTGVDADVLPEGSPARTVSTVLRSDFETASSSIIAAIRAPQEAGAEVADYADDLRELPGAQAVTAPQYLGSDTWQINVVSQYPTLNENTFDLVGEVREVETDLDVLVGGHSAQQVDLQKAIMEALPLALAILIILTVVALFLMTGSVILPIKALVMNLLTVSATFGILVLIFQDGRLEGLLNYTSQGALEATQPVFLFVIAFGLSTDYAVFLLTRIKEARDNGAGERESVALGLARTGRIVTAAALLFAIALGAFATSDIVFIKELGIGTALAVLIDATIVRALLVPSLMALLGRANWWAPGPLRRLHEKIGLNEGESGSTSNVARSTPLRRS